jgi:hypothetical protein
LNELYQQRDRPNDEQTANSKNTTQRITPRPLIVEVA